jgi:hypothetical protein
LTGTWSCANVQVFAVNLLFQSLLRRVHDLAQEIGVRDFRVQWKRNARGEVVVALIIADKEGPLAVDKLGGR